MSQALIKGTGSVQLKLLDLPTASSQGGPAECIHTYEQLWTFLFVRGMLPVAILRCDASKSFKFPIVNPPSNLTLHDSDRVYALVPSNSENSTDTFWTTLKVCMGTVAIFRSEICT